MAFESLSNRLTAAFKHIVGKDKLSNKNMESMLREIRTALLEADVNYKVVRILLNVSERKWLVFRLLKVWILQPWFIKLSEMK